LRSRSPGLGVGGGGERTSCCGHEAKASEASGLIRSRYAIARAGVFIPRGLRCSFGAYNTIRVCSRPVTPARYALAHRVNVLSTPRRARRVHRSTAQPIVPLPGSRSSSLAVGFVAAEGPSRSAALGNAGEPIGKTLPPQPEAVAAAGCSKSAPSGEHNAVTNSPRRPPARPVQEARALWAAREGSERTPWGRTHGDPARRVERSIESLGLSKDGVGRSRIEFIAGDSCTTAGVSVA